MMQLEQFEGPFRSLQDLKKVAFTEEYEVETHLAPWDLPSLVHPQPLPAPRRSSGRGRHSRRGGSELAVRLYGTTRQELLHRESFSASVLRAPEIIGSLTHRSERASLDNAFALIVGTRTNSDRRCPNWFKLRASRVRSNSIASLGER
jgi:hypothetical protein